MGSNYVASVMDDLWKKQDLDLKMTVYNVVPTEQDKAGNSMSGVAAAQ